MSHESTLDTLFNNTEYREYEAFYHSFELLSIAKLCGYKVVVIWGGVEASAAYERAVKHYLEAIGINEFITHKTCAPAKIYQGSGIND